MWAWQSDQITDRYRLLNMSSSLSFKVLAMLAIYLAATCANAEDNEMDELAQVIIRYFFKNKYFVIILLHTKCLHAIANYLEHWGGISILSI